MASAVNSVVSGGGGGDGVTVRANSPEGKSGSRSGSGSGTDGKQGLSSIYRACSVENVGSNQTAGGQPLGIRSLRANLRERTPSSWSLTKLFSCCGAGQGDNEENLGMEGPYGAPQNEDQVDVLDRTKTSTTCTQGPALTVDCSVAESVDKELQRLKSSIGDIIRRLVIKNSPIQPVLKIFLEPLVTANITSLHLENCDFTLHNLCYFLDRLKHLEQLTIEVQDKDNGQATKPSTVLQGDLQRYRTNSDLFQILQKEVTTSANAPASGLKIFRVSMPMTWQCSLICSAVEVMTGLNHLQQIVIKSSLKALLAHLVSLKVGVDKEDLWEHLVVLDARAFIQKHKNSLKHLSISCGDTFPLEYLKLTKTHSVPVAQLYEWSFFCTIGVLSAIVDDQKGHLILPELTHLTLDLPLVPIPPTKDDDLRKPLNAVAEFFAMNNGVNVVTLHGLRPRKNMEHWIKNSLITIPKFKMVIGCTYTSATLGPNLPVFDDELQSLSVEITEEDQRTRVTEIIDPNGLEVVPTPWRYAGMRCFHLVNQKPTLVSYDLDRIANRFNKLTKLIIEDYTRFEEQETNSTVGSLTDQDMQTIFQKMVMLEYLHLDCNMESVTDRGLTGLQESFWGRIVQKEKLVSFWQLCNVKYVFLRGLGDQVTDKSAIHAFSEEYSLKKLQELHVFAPGFTNFGREKIRRAYENRSGFILKL